MEFILTDQNKNELGFLSDKTELDLDVGITNDFVLEIALEDYDPALYSPGHYLICPGEEYGGVLNDPEVITSNKTISFTGDTFRGILSKKCIEPPQGKAYMSLSGELNECIGGLIGMHFDDLFTVSNVNTGMIIKNYQINRYCSLLDGIETMLASVGYRLDIKILNTSMSFFVMLSAVPVTDYSNENEYSQDSNVDFTIKKITNKYDYMICLGKGELLDRNIVYLHYIAAGRIEKCNSIPKGDDIRVYIYDYPNAENEEALIVDGIKKLNNLNAGDVQKLTIADNQKYELHDIVGGRDYITGLTIAQPITNKIIKINQGKATISYEIGGNT